MTYFRVNRQRSNLEWSQDGNPAGNLEREVGRSLEHATFKSRRMPCDSPQVHQPQTVIPFRPPTKAVEVSRDELAKGYEYEPGRFLVLSRAEMESITPPTAHEMQILEFVQLEEVDPIYFETSFYAAPERSGERAYGLLLAALRSSGLVGIAQCPDRTHR